MEKYYLFGCGLYGHTAYELIGEHNVVAFIDNDMEKIGTDKITGKSVISLEEYLHTSQDCIVISVSSMYAGQIERMLQEKNIENYVVFDDIVAMINKSEKCDVNRRVHNSKVANKIAEDIFRIADFESQVEFYIVDAFEIYHYLPLYNELHNQGIMVQMIAEPCGINSAGEWFNYYKAIDILEKLNISYRKLRNPNTKIAVTTQFYRNLCFYKCKKIQISYGVAVLKEKAFQLKYDVVRDFDYLFVHGQCQKDILVKNVESDKVVIMSYPKFIKKKEHCTKKDVKRKLGINTNKPILVYLPTWDEYSSTIEYADSIGRLKKDFFVIAKPHHCTERFPEKKTEMEMLNINCDVILSSDFDMVELATLCDYAICDGKSAVVYEMCFLNPIMQACVIMNKNLTIENFYIDIDKIAYTVYSPDELKTVLRNMQGKDKKKKSRQEEISYMFNSDICGCLHQAINIIKSEVGSIKGY